MTIWEPSRWWDITCINCGDVELLDLAEGQPPRFDPTCIVCGGRRFAEMAESGRQPVHSPVAGVPMVAA